MAASLLLSSLWGCKIDDNTGTPQRETYNFAKGVKLDPFKKEYLEGDIFWLEVNIPGKQLEAQGTGEDIFVSKATFFIKLEAEVLAAEPTPQSNLRFNAAQESGRIIKGADFDTNAEASLAFGCPDDDYFLRAGLEFEEKGNYILFLNRNDDVSLVTFTDDSDCSLQNIFPPPPEANLGYVKFTFDVEDTNLDVFNDVVGDNPNPILDSFREALENKTAFFISVR